MTLRLLREIASNIQSVKFYTITADEAADISNEEQRVICFRWVEEALSIHEDFIGLQSMPQTDADPGIYVYICKKCKL